MGRNLLLSMIVSDTTFIIVTFSKYCRIWEWVSIHSLSWWMRSVDHAGTKAVILWIQLVYDPYCSSATVMNLVSEPFHRFTSCISSPTNNNDGTVPLWSLTVSTAPIWTRKTERDVLGFVYDDVRRSSYKIESFCGHSCRRLVLMPSSFDPQTPSYIYCAALYGMVACLQSDEAFSRISCFIDGCTPDIWLDHQTISHRLQFSWLL
jgi:hypothetical protein